MAFLGAMLSLSANQRPLNLHLTNERPALGTQPSDDMTPCMGGNNAPSWTRDSMLHLNIINDDDVTGGGSSDESDVETEPGLTLRRKVRMMTKAKGQKLVITQILQNKLTVDV